VISHDTGYKYSSKLRSHRIKSARNKISKLINTLLRRAIVGLGEFFMNVSSHHVTAKTNHHAGIRRLGPPHVIEGQVDRGVDELVCALLRDCRVVGVDTTDFIAGNAFPVMPVGPYGDRSTPGARLSGRG